ncbi:MAG: ribonuclease R, partial [Chitinophagaceae bacterium]|nr:ribonuclease R [Chitinophagaceae bacterium]
MKKKKINKNRTGSNSFSHGIIKGRLEITRSGMGYVIIEKDGSDVMVKPGDFNTALNGDLVRVKVTKQNPRTGKREGKITEVVTRRQTEFIGYLQLSTNHAFFIPDSDKPMPDLFIPLSST